MRRNSFFARTVVSKAILASLCLAVPAGGAADVLDRTTPAAPANKKTWHAPKHIKAGDDAEKYSLEVSFNEAGDVIVFWNQSDNNSGNMWKSDNDRRNMWINSYKAGRGWGTARSIQINDIYHSNVAIDGRGNAIVASSRSGKIWTDRYESGKDWQEAQVIKETSLFNGLFNSKNANSVSDLRIAMNKAGNVVVAWTLEGNIIAKYYMSGKSWGDIQFIATDAGGTDVIGVNVHPKLLKVAMDKKGNAIAVWGKDEDPTCTNLWSNRYEVGKGWQKAQIIKKNASPNHEIAVDEAGNALVVWQQRDNGHEDNIWSNRYVAGNGWQKAQRINNGAPGCAEPPEVAFDGAGNGLAVWSECQRDADRTNLWFNRYTADVGWQKAQRIETGAAMNHAYHPKIAFDRAGNALAVWSQCSSKPTGIVVNGCNIRASRYVLGSGWEKAQSITTDADNAEVPQIAIDAAGNALAIWLQTDDFRPNMFGRDISEYDIWAARYE
ncbi:MAG: hypothetical protein CDV28_10875 [Candidatus Electronema aureum]|uniref:BNR repeat-containing family member n=1 Tax=Candidatus Electronema aureum TaxID=2005002 RepID=A0A521G2T4_9BACT|nr:MAG: hypothetical protein CDV28_10875 [Candidatus Electronema aureum]